MLYNVKKNKAQWEIVVEEEKKAAEQQKDGATANSGSASDSRKGSSGSSSQGSQVELSIEEAKQDNNKTTTSNMAVARIIVDGRPPTTITAVKIEQTVDVKPKLETVTETVVKSPEEESIVVDSKAADSGNTESTPTSAMASPSESVSVTVKAPSEESIPQVKRTERTQQQQESVSSPQPTRTNISSSTTTTSKLPTTEIRSSPVIARLSEKRGRSTSLDNMGVKKNVPNIRDRSSTATSSREVGSQATPVGVFTPPTPRAHIGHASPFTLRLYRRSHKQTPQPVESFGDPWVVRDKTSSPITHPQRKVESTDQPCAIHSGSGPHRTHLLSDGDVKTCCDGSSGMVLTGGLNNNVDVHAAKRLEKHKSQLPKAKASSSFERFERITGIRHDTQVTQSASYLSSTHYSRELTHSVTEPSHLRTGLGRALSPDIPRRRELRGDIVGRSHSERGSPFIRRKMEERREKDARRKEAAQRPLSTPSTYN